RLSSEAVDLLSDSDTDEDELEELREQTRGADRIDASADASGEDSSQQTDDGTTPRENEGEDYQDGSETERTTLEVTDGFVDDLDEVLAQVRRRERTPTVSATDPELSAFFSILSEREEERGELKEALKDEVGGGAGTAASEKEEVIRLALRLGLKEGVPEFYEVIDGS
ncbi:MAG: hypothetical protein SV760_07665, partial [Halobacteria archaeon]|nr:hypothetical protein [Halobacteria archaeon]